MTEVRAPLDLAYEPRPQYAGEVDPAIAHLYGVATVEATDEGDVEAANAVRQATQSVNRRSMAGESWQRARREQQAVIMLHCLRPDHDVANG